MYKLSVLILFFTLSACMNSQNGHSEPKTKKPIIKLLEKDIVINKKSVFPEGIAIAENGDVFLSSIQQGTILKVDAKTGAQQDFSKPNADLMSTTGLHISSDQKLLYACSADPMHQFASDRPSELISFDLKTGKVNNRFALPDKSFCNGIDELADGSIIISNSSQKNILKLPPDHKELTVLTTDVPIRLNGIAADGNTIYSVRFDTGELFRITTDPSNQINVDKIMLPRPLDQPDGLEMINSRELLVVESGSGSVSRILLNSDDAGEILIVTAGLDYPTSAALFNGYAYIVQAQFDHMGKNAPPHEPFTVKKVKLKK